MLSHEAEGSTNIEDALERALEKLRLHLAKLMGLDAFILLLVRSITFARSEYPWLSTLKMEMDGTLQGLHFTAHQQAQSELQKGFTALLSHFFALLTDFVGEALTLRLIQSTWSDLDLGGQNLDEEEPEP